jgi:transcriptional regulator with XRE-family HTH domain
VDEIIMEKFTLGQLLKKTREDRGYTLREVEELSGVSNAYLSQMESDKIKRPSPVWLHKLADTYEISYSTLLGLAGYPVPGENQSSSAQSSLAARIGEVTSSEEDALVEYLEFIRSRQIQARRKKR